MAVKIRLQRKGRRKRPFYFIVAAHEQHRRDGRFVEKLGTYNPLTVPASINLNRERALFWLQQGAQPTNTIKRILSFKGVLFWKHLLRGVDLGLFDLQTAKKKFETWITEHEKAVKEKQERHEKHKKELRELAWKESADKKKAKNTEAEESLRKEVEALATDNQEQETGSNEETEATEGKEESKATS